MRMSWFGVELKECVHFQVMVTAKLSLRPKIWLPVSGSPLNSEGDVGHKAHNHCSQDGAIDRDEVVGGTGSPQAGNSADHRGHHI